MAKAAPLVGLHECIGLLNSSVGSLVNLENSEEEVARARFVVVRSIPRLLDREDCRITYVAREPSLPDRWSQQRRGQAYRLLGVTSKTMTRLDRAQ